MKKSTLIVSLLVTSLIAFAAVWFWALRPYITPLVSSHSVHTEGHAIEYVRSPLQAPPADLVRHIWHFRLIQPEWVSNPPDYVRWSKAETEVRLIVVFLGCIVSSTFIVRR